MLVIPEVLNTFSIKKDQYCYVPLCDTSLILNFVLNILNISLHCAALEVD